MRKIPTLRKVQLDAEWDILQRKVIIKVAINYEILSWVKLTGSLCSLLREWVKQVIDAKKIWKIKAACKFSYIFILWCTKKMKTIFDMEHNILSHKAYMPFHHIWISRFQWCLKSCTSQYNVTGWRLILNLFLLVEETNCSTGGLRWRPAVYHTQEENFLNLSEAFS